MLYHEKRSGKFMSKILLSTVLRSFFFFFFFLRSATTPHQVMTVVFPTFHLV